MPAHVVEAARPEERALLQELEARLYALKWPVKRPKIDGTRKNVLTCEGQAIRAFAMGKVRQKDLPYELVESKYNRKFPELLALLRRLMRLHDPAFKYNAIQLNHNVTCAPHYDRNNRGPSYCLAVGAHTGGGLALHTDAPGRPVAKVVFNRHKWVHLDAARTLHSTAPPSAGDRFAVIFYKTYPRLRRGSGRRSGKRSGKRSGRAG